MSYTTTPNGVGPPKQQQQQAINDESDEAQILASVSATVQEQDLYEDQVIRQATNSLAPLLPLVEQQQQQNDNNSSSSSTCSTPPAAGFPSLHGLAPSAQQHDSYNPSDLPHFYSILTQIRRQQQQQHESSNNNNNTDILYLQEQMILHYLQHVAGVSVSDLPIRDDEAKRERERSEALRQQQYSTAAAVAATAKKKKKKVSFSSSLVTTTTIKRIPMMQRKQQQLVVMQQSKANVTEEEERQQETAQRKEELRKLRQERKQRQEERRKQFLSDDDDSSSSSSSSSEEEFEQDSVSIKEEQTDEAEQQKTETTTTTITTVTCPLCQQTLEIPDASQTDALLAQHMQDCQTTGRSRRSRRDASGTSVRVVVVAATHKRPPSRKRKRSAKQKKAKNKTAALPHYATSSKDDLQEWVYMDRVDDWIERGVHQMKDMKQLRDADDELPGAETYTNGLYIPAWINDRLFGYQREGLRWMWDLHQQQAGGVVGDQMGLGKTVQVSSFLGVMAANRKLRSVLIVAPATMLQHWLNELAIWAPGLRRILVHPSGETDGVSRNLSPQLLRTLAKWLKRSRKDRVNEAIDEKDWETMEHHAFCGTGYAVITTYENLRRNADIYIEHEWSYVVLDEAQKIKNPDADITLAVKRIRTPHRLAMSGTPIQNDLRELWSLFDFVFPGRLGTLPAFEQEFADPIKRGGYSNASPMQVQLAYRCSLTLRDLINPFLLRRLKKEVKEVERMPKKTEHVLFCRLTARQREMYAAFIRSDDVLRVLRGSSNLLAAVTVLRKICNHPDLICDPDEASFQSFLKNGPANLSDVNDDDENDDDYLINDQICSEETLMQRSGKLEVLSKILPLWHKQGHRVLIFCQWKKMLDIIQRFMMLKGWKFGRLDGDTNVSARQRLVDQFNTDDSLFCLLCTTRTGGVGLNLTGASRLILYDPDWNQAIDSQARERAWRFGQEKEVTIYRLITAGTIEEKIYQRQIFKTALSNKILQDPRQRRLFSQRDLHDLFSLTEDGGSVRAGGDGLTDTGKVTRGVGVVDFDQDVGTTDDDNDRTLRKVMKSKGLAGVFDHHYLEEDTSRKSTTVREMEEQAKKVAREAARALEQSLPSHDRFTPTWTGSEETKRFGNNGGTSATSATANGPPTMIRTTSGFTQASVSSRDILSSLRQKNHAVESNGQVAGVAAASSEETQQYAELLVRLKDFVRRRSPSTDEILQEFDSVPNCDVAIFRRLLKSVADIDGGRWYLK